MSEVWTTKTGQVIPLVEMTDSHLKNTYLYVKRRQDAHFAIAFATVYCPSTDADGTADFADPPFDGWLPILLEEAKRRGMELEKPPTRRPG